MAQDQPCKICETEGVHSLSDWLITAQSENQGFPPGTTFYVCIPCLAGLMVAWLQEQQNEPSFTSPGSEAGGESLPETPGVLEAVEADEGRVDPAPNGTGGTKSGPADTEPEAEVPEAETETADVNS